MQKTIIKKLCNLFNLCYNILRISQERMILNEKILTLAAGALLVVGMASCSNKNNTSGVDNTALKLLLLKNGL